MKNSKPNFDAVGIDIGTHSIKLAYFKGDTLVNLGVQEISQDTPISTLLPEERDSAISTALKKIFAAAQVSVKKAIVSVSGDAVVVRYIILPKITEKELEATIKFEAEPYISFPMEQAVIDFQILGDNDEENIKRMNVLLVAAKREAIDRQVNLLKNVGARPVLIDVDAFALENIFENIVEEGENAGGIVLLNIGATYTNINIIENGVSRFTRDVSIAGNNFTKALQRDLKLDYRAAEELKKTQGVILNEEEIGNNEVMQISGILRPVFHELMGEIRRSLDYYQAQSGERSLKKIVLSGGSALLKNIEKAIAQETKLSVEKLNPFKKAKIAVKSMTSETIAEIQDGFAVSMGLALRVKS